VVSLAILVAYNQLSDAMLSPLVLAAVAGLATIVENLGVRGLDNLLVPLLVACLLTM
jgi:dolichol kinase